MSKFISLSVLAAATILSYGCAASAGPDKAEVAPDLTHKGHAASSGYVKPGASVGYSHNLAKQVEAGDTVNFDLTLQEGHASGALNVDVSASGLSLTGSSVSQSFDMAEGNDHIMTVSFTAPSNGRYYINVSARAETTADEPKFRVFSIPVQVGPEQKMKSNPNMQTMPSGESIIVMDAEEEIIPN